MARNCKKRVFSFVKCLFYEFIYFLILICVWYRNVYITQALYNKKKKKFWKEIVNWVIRDAHYYFAGKFIPQNLTFTI